MNMMESLTEAMCRVFGHKWQAIPPTGIESVFQVCLRCRENGWRIRTDW